MDNLYKRPTRQANHVHIERIVFASYEILNSYVSLTLSEFLSFLKS